MASSTIRRAGDATVAVVTLDRVDRRNALDVETCLAVTRYVEESTSDGARALVLTGAGGSFCAGADLDEVQRPEFAPALRGLLASLARAPFPCVAALEGPVMGAGVQLAVACDLRVATSDARLAVPAGRLGLMVDGWTAQRLAQLAGFSVAQAMLLGDEALDGRRAVEVGLVQRLGHLEDALAWADEIAALAPLSLAGHKLALNLATPFAPPPPELDQAHARAWSSEDLAEGMAAFRDRRPPRFRGR